jgi:predicted DNA-binding protein with PD1-like motif
MQSRLLHQQHGERTFVIAFRTGEKLIAGLREFARSEDLAASEFHAIGALQEATIAFFDWESKSYKQMAIRTQLELLSLIGHVTLPADAEEEGERNLHVHVVLGRRDGSASGGNLMEAVVRPTCEVVLTEQPAHLVRRKDPESGLPLIAPEVELDAPGPRSK